MKDSVDLVKSDFFRFLFIYANIHFVNMNFGDFSQHQKMLGENILSLYLELGKIAQYGLIKEAREKCSKLGSSFTEERKEYLNNERDLQRM